MPDLSVMSFNIRCICDKGTEHWDARFPRIMKLLEREDADLIGFQEATYKQYQDLCVLGNRYGHEGKGRDDGYNAGEFMAVFYKKDKFEIIETESFWLSSTPEKPGLGWDAACIRMCTYVKLRVKSTGRVFCHFNTHLDHVGKIAMKEGAKLVRKYMLETKLPCITTGDFNVSENSEPYMIMAEDPLADTKYIAKNSFPYGTFHGYNPSEDLASESPIDYIFVTKSDFTAENYKVLVNGGKGEFSSDHYPVISLLNFK